MKSSPELEAKLLDLSNKGILAPRTENNKYLKVSYRGAGTLISDKWNIKIYTSGSIVCLDSKILEDLIHDRIKPPDASLITIQIDDSGGGFPLLGVMVGVSDNKTILTDTVGVRFFQAPLYGRKAYLTEYTSKGLALVRKFGAAPKTHRIEICSGYINSRIKNELREMGFDVRIVEVKGLLQDKLEDLFRQYVKDSLGVDLAYDPKEFASGKEIGKKYRQVVAWGKANAPQYLKTGWESLRNHENI